MTVAGLSTYSSESFYYTRTQKTKNRGLEGDDTYGFLENSGNNQNALETTGNKPAVQVPYSRCITASIRTEEMFATQSSDGEILYSYKASEQSFKIWINSDGENKTYSIEGIDKDGKPFTKEFDPYNVDPEYADFPEFSALCMYIQNTDETADLLANDYFSSEDILEKKNYMEMLEGFGSDEMYAGMELMQRHARKLFDEMKNFINQISLISANDTDRLDLLMMDVEDMEKAIESEKQPVEEELIPLGMGFANAGIHGHGMSATQVVSSDSKDVIVRVKIDGQTVDVNVSKVDPRNATPVEMFAYCQYMDSIGKGVGSKWGSWNAMKWVAASGNDGTMDFGSLDNIMNKKMDWSGKLAASKRSMEHEASGKTISAADVLKMFEEASKIQAEDLKSDDWRDMSDDAWDKMLEGIDKYIEDFKEDVEKMKELQEEAAKKAALEAPSDMRANAAAQAALSAASGFGDDGNTSSGEGAMSEDEELEKNWTKKLKTDDQTVLRTAKAAQEMEKMAAQKIKDIIEKQPLKLIAMDRNGIRCINDETGESEWEIKFRNESEYKRAERMMKWAGDHMNNYEVATDEKRWMDYLSGIVNDGSFKNALRTKEA